MPRSSKTWAKYPKQIEVNYYRSIKEVVSKIRRLYKELIEPEISGLLCFEYPGVSMDDSVTEKIGKLFHTFRVNYYGQEYPLNGDQKTIVWRRGLEYKVESNAKSIARIHKQRLDQNQKFVIGVDPLKKEPWLSPYISDWTAQNVSLIKDIPDSAIDQLEELLVRSILRGDNKGFILDQIQNILSVSETRSARIARDQSNKMYGTLTELRSRFNGWEFYEWSTSNDERVRMDHKRLEGKIFKWSQPPVTVRSGKRAGEKNNPGFDINCFKAGTMVNTKNGQKKIEDIKIGDTVHSHSGLEKVVETHKNHYEGNLIGIKFLHKTIWVTPNHKFFIDGRGWVAAESLKIGDKPKKFEELFAGNFLNKKVARNIEHPHPHFISNNLMSDRVYFTHSGLDFYNSVKFFKKKIGLVINTIFPVRFFKNPLWSIIYTKNIKPSSAINFGLRNNTIFTKTGNRFRFGGKMLFSSFWVINPLCHNSFASMSNRYIIHSKHFFNNPSVCANNGMDFSVRPKFVNVFFSKPLFKIFSQNLFKILNMVKKKSLIGAFNRTINTAPIFDLGFNGLKRFATNFAINKNILVSSSHNILHKISLLKDTGTIYDYAVVSIESQYHNGDIYNIGVTNGMSYFADGILAANCRCLGLPIYDQNIINNLKRQPDGSYAVPKSIDITPKLSA